MISKLISFHYVIFPKSNEGVCVFCVIVSLEKILKIFMRIQRVNGPVSLVLE